VVMERFMARGEDWALWWLPATGLPSPAVGVAGVAGVGNRAMLLWLGVTKESIALTVSKCVMGGTCSVLTEGCEGMFRCAAALALALPSNAGAFSVVALRDVLLVRWMARRKPPLLPPPPTPQWLCRRCAAANMRLTLSRSALLIRGLACSSTSTGGLGAPLLGGDGWPGTDVLR
jgi:hypothetical protein